VLGQEQRRGVGNAAQPLLRHREHPKLVDRTEAVLERPDEPEAGIRIAFEVEHRIDDVLQHARPRERPLFRHVTDEHERDAAALRDARQLRGALADLRDRTGCRGQRIRIQRLDRVDHRDLGLLGLERRRDALELDLREEPDVSRVDTEPLRAQRGLLRRLLAGDVDRFARRAHPRERLEQQRRLADAGIAADQHHLPGDEPAAERAVELRHASRHADGFPGRDTRERRQRGGFRDAAEAVLGGPLGRGLEQRVPGAAVRALPLPLRGCPAALAADVDGFCLGHPYARSTWGTRGASAHSNS
jgi:hypothetical protein